MATGIFPLLVTIMLTACVPVQPAHIPEKIEPVQNTVDPQLSEIDGLDEETLYRLLVAEMAGRQAQHDTALENYLWAARHTGRLEVISRAMNIANFIGNQQAAAELAELWLQQEPEANRPHLTLASTALDNNDTDTALHHLRFVMQKPGLVAAKLWLVMGALDRFAKDLQIEILDSLLQETDGSPEATLAYVRLLMQVEEPWRAEEALARLLQEHPENEQAVILYASILRDQGQEQYIVQWLGQHMQNHPDQLQVRSYYARMLVMADLYMQAMDQLELILEEEPDDNSTLLLLASMQTESGQTQKAAKNLEKLVWSEADDYSDEAAWRLGLIAEDDEDHELAIKWYQLIEDPELAAAAMVRSIPLEHGGDIAATRSAFATLAESQPQLLSQINEIEAIWLAKNGMYEEALAIYDSAIAREDNHFWRYSRAIMAEEYGDDFELFEQDMRHIISQEENHAEALNALGYTLADKTDRLEEAYGLIYRANLLKPNNFYILDSMGWVLFRLGYNQEAMEHLRRAYSIREDPEIAIHIVRVMVASGQTEEARLFLRKNIRLFPDNEELQTENRQLSQ